MPRVPTAAHLLDLWERAEPCSAPVRALLLLAYALPEEDRETLAAMDLGLRDWHLLRLRRAMFGSAILGHTDCPRCGERLQIELDAEDLQDDALPPPEAPQYVASNGQRFRLPNSADLVAIAEVGDVEAAARALFARCALSDADASVEAHTTEVEEGLAALADDRAFRLDLRCAACDERWIADFDPASFLWGEIRARALELLDDVHRLASAYGWRERDILRMSDARRAAYLERID